MPEKSGGHLSGEASKTSQTERAAQKHLLNVINYTAISKNDSIIQLNHVSSKSSLQTSVIMMT